MQAPDFWQQRGLVSTVLLPLGGLYSLAGRLRPLLTHQGRVAVPVICVGNLTAGGTGKTPTVLSLLTLVRGFGWQPAAVTRGYGGREEGPLQVDLARHSAKDVGDEALLLAAAAPTFVARHRLAGAKAAVAAGATMILLDDGFQNPTLHKDLSLLVVDGAVGFGNGRVLPAGPLREPVARGLARADAVLVIGPPQAGLLAQLQGHKVLTASLVPQNAADFAGKDCLAFAGIGRPTKFFDSLRAAGARLRDTVAFPDHHPYSEAELAALADRAQQLGAPLVTTEKDAMRLSPAWRHKVRTLKVALQWNDPRARDLFLEKGLNGR